MTREKLIDKYMDVFKEMNALSGKSDDINVLLGKLIYLNHKKHGRDDLAPGNDVYPVPETFDWDAFEVDYQEVTKVGA